MKHHIRNDAHQLLASAINANHGEFIFGQLMQVANVSSTRWSRQEASGFYIRNLRNLINSHRRAAHAGIVMCLISERRREVNFVNGSSLTVPVFLPHSSCGRRRRTRISQHAQTCSSAEPSQDMRAVRLYRRTTVWLCA